MQEIIKNILNTEVADLPIGKAVLLTAAFGLSGGLAYTLDSFTKGKIPPIATQAAVAMLVTKVAPIERFMGADLVDLIAVASLANGLNAQFDMMGKINTMISKLVSPLVGNQTIQTTATPATSSPPAAATGGYLGGYDMGNYPSVGALPDTRQNVDDVDLALLSARGFQTA